MEAKEIVKKAYEAFGKGDMQTMFNDLVHDDCTWIFPGEVGKHPLSGTHKGKQAMMETFQKIPGAWDNFQVIPGEMISEGNKVFVKCEGKASGMNTMFGHFFEVADNGKISTMITYDDTLSMFNAMKK